MTGALQTVVVDVETFWDVGYSLSKLSFIEYIHDERFEVISVSIKVGDGPTETHWGPMVDAALQAVDWANSACIAHNGNEFDFPLLVWKYGIRPKLFIDTACMARPKHQSGCGVSLKALSEFYGLPAKDATILHNTKGKRYKDFDLAEMVAMGKYNRGDVDNTYSLYKIFGKHTPKSELLLSDMTARAICFPQLMCDTVLLNTALQRAEADQENVLQSLTELLGCLDTDEVRKELSSAKKFAAVLTALDVDVPMKTSKTTGKPTYALAKTDQAMQDLLQHEDPRVQSVAAARLNVKSTLLQTRLAKMAHCAELMGGWMTVPLGYHSATTGRWGGRVWNPQNLPRIPRDKAGNIIYKPTNALRLGLVAPPGYKVVVSDLSGIELRVNHYLWNVQSSMELYAKDPRADLYIEFAAAAYGKAAADVTKDERQMGKVAHLGLGFGAGWQTFQRFAKVQYGLEIDDAEAQRIVLAWRTKYIDIVRGWKKCQTLVAAMYSGAAFSPDPRGLVVADREACVLPSGRRLYYPYMSAYTNAKGFREYEYGQGAKKSKVYAGLMDENLVQAIARDVISEHAIKIYLTTGYYPALMVHDELVYVVPANEADSMLAYVNSIMRVAPDWLPDLVLWSEGDIADSYGDAK